MPRNIFVHITVIFMAVFGLVSCYPFSNDIEVKEAYSFATPKNFPAAAVFMVIENHTAENDRMIDFKTDRAGRTELHTMAMKKGIMRMRQVDGYDVATGESHVLKPMADHIMLFRLPSTLEEGESFSATAIFEKAGEVPVNVTVKPRADMKKHAH